MHNLVYAAWGYGGLDYCEDPTRLRRAFQFPDASLVFTVFPSFPGHNQGLPIDESFKANNIFNGRFDKDNNFLPNNIRRYSFEDEYTYRV